MNGNQEASSSSPRPLAVQNGMPNGLHPSANGEKPVDMSALFAQKREEELARRDRSLAEFLVMLDGYKPLVSLPVLDQSIS